MGVYERPGKRDQIDHEVGGRAPQDLRVERQVSLFGYKRPSVNRWILTLKSFIHHLRHCIKVLFDHIN